MTMMETTAMTTAITNDREPVTSVGTVDPPISGHTVDMSSPNGIRRKDLDRAGALCGIDRAIRDGDNDDDDDCGVGSDTGDKIDAMSTSIATRQRRRTESVTFLPEPVHDDLAAIVSNVYVGVSIKQRDGDGGHNIFQSKHLADPLLVQVRNAICDVQMEDGVRVRLFDSRKLDKARDACEMTTTTTISAEWKFLNKFSRSSTLNAEESVDGDEILWNSPSMFINEAHKDEIGRSFDALTVAYPVLFTANVTALQILIQKSMNTCISDGTVDQGLSHISAVASIPGREAEFFGELPSNPSADDARPIEIFDGTDSSTRRYNPRVNASFEVLRATGVAILVFDIVLTFGLIWLARRRRLKQEAEKQFEEENPSFLLTPLGVDSMLDAGADNTDVCNRRKGRDDGKMYILCRSHLDDCIPKGSQGSNDPGSCQLSPALVERRRVKYSQEVSPITEQDDSRSTSETATNDSGSIASTPHLFLPSVFVTSWLLFPSSNLDRDIEEGEAAAFSGLFEFWR